MPDIDKVLEAEESIRTIATELEKMKSAAELMDSAQEKIDAVIETSKDITTKTGEFVKEGTQIVERLGDYDIQGDLSKIIESTANIKSDTGEISEYFADIKTKLGNLKNDLETFFDEKFKEIEDSLNDIRGQNEQTGKIIMGLIGGNIILGIIILLKVFQVI